MNTYSTLQNSTEVQRDGLLHCIGTLIDEEFGGVVERTDLYDLCIATAVSPAELKERRWAGS
jgi:hypothetical protein